MMSELEDRLSARGWTAEWQHLCDDLDEMQEQTVTMSGKRFVFRTAPTGEAGKALQAAGVALGPTVRLIQ